MNICTLYLVRHGQTQWNVDKRIQGHKDIPLNEVGEQQAHEQRELLKGISFSKVYSSDLIRAKRTAEILNLERKLAHETTKTLRERSFGTYEGTLMEEGKKKLWDLLANYNEHPYLTESKVEVNEQVIGRSITFLREISVAHPGQTILVVTHGGVMRQILLHLGYAIPSMAIQNLAYIKIECDGVDFTVKRTFGITLQLP